MGKSQGAVRVAGGVYRGRMLRVPPGTRPTVGRVREALFSIWQDELGDARVLDLFAGSGVVAAEAVGRGAAEVLAIEGDRAALGLLQSNFAPLQAGERLRAQYGKLPQALAPLARRRPASFDLIFADPPYSYRDYERLLLALPPLLDDGGQVALEHGGSSTSNAPPEEVGVLMRVEHRLYGESHLSFYRRRKKAISSR